MSSSDIECDYLVVGGGATAMAFVDTLLAEDRTSSIAIVDRQHRPGGHWNDAYPFVRLHQPAAYYGVASRELGSTVKEVSGLNAGLYALASGAQVLAYFDEVMQHHFLPTGRVRWLPMSEYFTGPDGSHRVRSLTSAQSRTVTVRKKLVNATHAQTAVPSTHPPKYAVADGVRCIPLNDLPKIKQPFAAYTVVGSGKTGMDAILWLLENGVAASHIRWIMPRDAWMMNRANFQPGLENFERSVGSNTAQLETIAGATDIASLFDQLEARELLMRIDKKVQPSTYRCAVVSKAELSALRSINDIVRLGRVERIEADRIVLEKGSVPADPGTLYIDCSASAIVMPPKLKVFDGNTINLLMLRTCQPLFSAAVIAYLEAHVQDDESKNGMARVVPSPEKPIDWLRMWLVSLVNGAAWRQHAGLSAWQMRCRLNAFAVFMRDVKPDDAQRMSLVQAMGAQSPAAAANLQVLLASANSAS